MAAGEVSDGAEEEPSGGSGAENEERRAVPERRIQLLLGIRRSGFYSVCISFFTLIHGARKAQENVLIPSKLGGETRKQIYNLTNDKKHMNDIETNEADRRFAERLRRFSESG